jgi:hypothetical protein
VYGPDGKVRKTTIAIFHDKDTRNVLFRSGVEFVNFPEQADVLIGNRESLIQDFITKFAAAKFRLAPAGSPGTSPCQPMLAASASEQCPRGLVAILKLVAVLD